MQIALISQLGGGANGNVKDNAKTLLSDDEDTSNNLSNDSIIIDDSNFNEYFDADGFLSPDIKEDSQIYFGNVSNRHIKIDIPIKLSSLYNSTVFNSTIELTKDGSGSVLENLNFYTQCTQENSDYLSPIYLNEASDVLIENNFIYMDYYDGCNYNLAGIYAFGSSNNNSISNNRISIYYKSENSSNKYYIYGIDFSSFSFSTYAQDNARGNKISSNIIDVQSNYYANGIALSCTIDSLVESNELHLKSDSFAYGITSEYFDNGYGVEASHNFTIRQNSIEASSSMVYAIQIFDVYDVGIYDNSIKSFSNATYGISGYSSHDHEISGNSLIISGADVSQIGINFDAIGTGHSGIYYTRESSDISIHNNRILSNYTSGGDYAIKFDESSNKNISVYNNYISSNGFNYNGNDAVNGENITVYDNSPYNDEETAAQGHLIVYDVYVDLNGNDKKGNGSVDKPFLSINKALNYLSELSNNLSRSSNSQLKGILHLGEGNFTGYGTNLRLYINNLNLEIIGAGYNKTVIDGKSSHWFFDISEDSDVSIKNISFVDGVNRYANTGIIHNKGKLDLMDCIFKNAKLSSTSAIVYNDGLLKLKNNIMELTANGYHIFNNGQIDGLNLNFIKDSLNEDERILNSDTISFKLSAFIHDDNGNPISGGYVRFFMEGKEILINANLSSGLASLYTYSSLNGILKVSGYYSNAYTNFNSNIGRVNSTVISDTVLVFVSYDADEALADGSIDKPFKSINQALALMSSCVEPVTINLLDNSTSEIIDDSCLNRNNVITISGTGNKTYVLADWTLSSDANLKLNNFIFDGHSLVKENTDLTIDSCIFTNSNTSAILSVNGSLNVLNTNFTNNNVKDSHLTDGIFSPPQKAAGLWWYRYIPDKAGAIDNTLSNLTILNCSFAFNEAYTAGAIFNNQSDLHISNSSFISNLAFNGNNNETEVTATMGISNKGGAIFQYLGEEVVITDTVFYNNTAGGYGGAFYSTGIFPNDDDITSIIEGYPYIYTQNENGFLNNYGDYTENPYSPQNIYFVNCVFDSNLAPRGGGAVYSINNSLTRYISCDFLNNMAYTYDMKQLFGNLNKNRANWIYEDQLDEVYNIFYVPVNNGGAIHDNNLQIIDSTFSGNTLESGGSVILPTIISYSADLGSLSKYTAGTSITNSVTGSESVYVADSSLLTADDSRYLGINGWTGTSKGTSIRKIINENQNGNGHGGNGTGTAGSGDGAGGSGDGTGLNGNGNGGTLSWGDILSKLGGDSSNINIAGKGSSFADFINNIINSKTNSSSQSSSNGSGSSNASGNSSSQNPTGSSDVTNGSSSGNASSGNPTNVSDGTESGSNTNITNGSSELPTNSSSEIPDNVENITNSTIVADTDENITTNTTIENTDSESENSELEGDSDVYVDDEDSHSDVGLSEDPLSGNPSESQDSSDSSSAESQTSNSPSPGLSSDSPSPSPNAYELTKEESSIAEKNIDVYNLILIIIAFFALLILGYYRQSRKEEDE